jgi:protoporphyrinogen oxidase
MESKKVKTLIIGGGISGLSTASFLNDDYLILEKESEVGGYCKTTIRNGFVWDYSGHFFHFNDEKIKNYMIEKIDCEVVEVKKNTKIFYKNNYIDFPFQYNIHQLETNEFIDCLYDLYKKKETNSTTFKSFVKSTLGESISNKFIIPYNEKLYACDLDKLDYDSMGRFFPKLIDFNQIMENIKSKNVITSYNDTFIYPKNGTYEFIKSILKRVDTDKIKLKTKVNNIDLDKKILHTENEKYEFENLVNTIPFNHFSKLCGQNHQDLSYNKVVVFNLGFDSSTSNKNHWVYYPGDEIFYRVGFYNNILSQEKLSLYVEIGMNHEKEINEKDLLNQILIDLKSVGVIETHKLIDYQMIVMSPAYVHINQKSKKIFKDWCDEYNKENIFSIGRYGSWTYCSIEDNIIEGKKTAELINKNLHN